MTDYDELFATFLAYHKRVMSGDTSAAMDAQHASVEIMEAMRAYNPFALDLWGGQVKIDDTDKTLFEECWKAYRRKGSKKKSLDCWGRIGKNEKQVILRHINAYVSSREICYQKDFERYLRDKTYLEIIVKGNMVVYDPSRTANSEYKPEQSYSLIWNEADKIFVFVGFWDGGFIPDGYDDNSRPDGARIMLNNGRGIIEWSASQKQWNRHDRC